MQYFALFYEVVDEFPAKRAPFREDHLQHVRESHERGILLLASAFSEPVDSALLVFRCGDRSIPEQFARADPYVMQGLVTRWYVRRWTQVIATEPGEHALVGSR